MNCVFWTMIISLLVFGFVGLRMARKICNGDSFYVMEQKAPTLFLVCGICMSYISAVTMSSGPGICYENGPFLLLASAQPGAWFGMIVAILFIGRKLKAIGCYTMPEYFSKRFADNNVTCLSLVIMVTTMEIYGISQLVAIGSMLKESTGLSYGAIIAIFTLAMMFFCVPGGTWGIMMTDTIMFAVVLLTAFVVCPVVIHTIYPEAIGHIPADFWTLEASHELPAGYQFSQAILWFTFFAGSPVIITRVFPAKNDFSVVKATVISVALIAMISSLLYFTASLMRGTSCEIIFRDEVMLQAFLTYAPLPLGLIGVAGILTAAISTAAVLFSLAGFSVSRDLFRLLNACQGEVIDNIPRARLTQAFAVGIGGIIACIQPGNSFDLSLFACGIFAASWLPTILMSFLWKRYHATAAFYGMLSGALVLTLLQSLISFRGLVLPDYLNQYVLSMLVSLVVSVVLTLCRPAPCDSARRHYQIRSAQLSDQVIREARTRPNALKDLWKGYHQTRKTMYTVIVLSVVFWGVAGFLFYRYVL